MLDILALDFIDAKKTISNDIIEIYNILGIEAARQAIFDEFSEAIEFDGAYINYHHLTMLADRMCCNEKLVSVFRHGINNDDIGPIAKASFEETPEMFLKAAKHGELDIMRGVSANIMCGQEGYFGTSSFKLLLNMDKMSELKLDKYEESNDENEEQIDLLKELDTIQDLDECSTNNLQIESMISNLKAINMGTNDEYIIDF